MKISNHNSIKIINKYYFGSQDQLQNNGVGCWGYDF